MTEMKRISTLALAICMMLCMCMLSSCIDFGGAGAQSGQDPEEEEQSLYSMYTTAIKKMDRIKSCEMTVVSTCEIEYKKTDYSVESTKTKTETTARVSVEDPEKPLMYLVMDYTARGQKTSVDAYYDGTYIYVTDGNRTKY